MSSHWWKESVVYQIYPRSFMDSNGDGIGDINGIRKKIPYLRDLGVDVIWLSPIYESPNDDNGYDISNYKGIMKELGSMDDFDAMLFEAHELGLKVILDLVVNHTSDEHAWFESSRKSVNSPHRDYYIWRDGKDGNPPNNWESFFGGSAWEYDQKTGMHYLHLFSKKQPDLNWDNPVLREKIYDMMKWWLDKGIDGFRMDVINFISKVDGLPDGEVIAGTNYTEKAPYISCGPRFHKYLKEMHSRVLSKYNIITVGEAPFIDCDEALKTTDEDENELNMVFQFEHMDLENEGNNKWTSQRFELIKLKETMSKWQYALCDRGWNSLYWNNHDQPRVVSRFGDDSKYWAESAKMLATCLHLLKGTPYIYQGEEIGMTNVRHNDITDYNDIETVNAYQKFTQNLGYSNEKMMACVHARSRDNARTPMQWNENENAGFSQSQPWIKINENFKEINVENQLVEENSILKYYKKLIRLRKKYPEIVYGDYEEIDPKNNELYIYKRTYDGKTLIVVCNFTSNTVKYPLQKIAEKLNNPKILISNYSRTKISEENYLLPYEAICIRYS